MRKLGAGRIKQYLAALRFLYAKTLGRPEAVSFICWPKQPQRLPAVLAICEVFALLKALRVAKYRVLAATLYATGMRVSEVCRMKVTDIDAARGVIRVIGKGNKERLVMMSPRLLLVLRTYWKLVRPARPYLFTNDDGRPMNPKRHRRSHLDRQVSSRLIRSAGSDAPRGTLSFGSATGVAYATRGGQA